MALFENKKTEKPKTYDLELRCKNCGDYAQYEVPFGKSWESFVKENTCDNCGCLALIFELGDSEEDEE